MLNNLKKITSLKKRRLGQGEGSGRGKTAGRGTKGQRSRGKISIMQGIAGISLVRRLPLYRGKYRNKGRGKRNYAVNINVLNIFPAGSQIDREALIKKGIISKDLSLKIPVKLLGDGELEKALDVKLSCSKGARKKIEKAGGKVLA